MKDKINKYVKSFYIQYNYVNVSTLHSCFCPMNENVESKHRIIDEMKEFGKICVSAFAMLYRPGSTHRPHMTYVPHGWPGMGNGGGRWVHQGSTGQAPLPLDSTSSLRQSYCEKTTT